MCIICYKPTGAALPSRSTLENCFNNNPDGAGFMVQTEQGVKISKGYFNFNELWEALNVHDLTAFNVGIHCRITTHGATCEDNCHPFAIARRLKSIRKTNTTTPAAVMHNGILTSVEVPRGSQLSDTIIFTRDILARLRAIKGGALTENRNAVKIINSLIGSSRLLIFDEAGVKMFGNFTEHKGCYYSNDSYLSYSYWDTLTTFNAFNKFDDVDDEAVYLDDYTPRGSLLFNACEDCWNKQDCKRWGAYCQTETEAQDVAYNLDVETTEQGVLYGI